MDGMTVNLGRRMKTQTKMGHDCSKEFEYFSGKHRMKKINNYEKTKKLLPFKLRLPRLKIPKMLKTLRTGKANNSQESKGNSQVSINILDLNKCVEHKRKQPYGSECAKCYFGDSSFSCSCDFQNSSPDYKIYDGDVQFIIYFINAFFC